MNPVIIPDATSVLPAPANWDSESNGRCGALHVRSEVIDGVQFLHSAWEPNTDEIGAMLVGAKVLLGVTPVRTGESSYSHPVVHLGTLETPAEAPPAITIRQFATLAGEPCIRVEMFCPKGKTFLDVAMANETLASATAFGVAECEARARLEGWIA